MSHLSGAADLWALAAEAGGSGLPWWGWLAAAALVVLGAVGIVVLVVGGRRTGLAPWDQDLVRQSADARWFHDILAPQVADRSRPVRDVQDAWHTHLPAVRSTEQQLHALATRAPDDARRSNAARLGAATTALREALDAEVDLRADHQDADHETAGHETHDHVTHDHVTHDHVTHDHVTHDHVTHDDEALADSAQRVAERRQELAAALDPG